MAIMQYTHNEPSFSPLDYTPIAWYDSSDVSTISKDISDKVSEWRDKSGLGYHLVQGTDLNKPIYSGASGIYFDGSNDEMSKILGVTYPQPSTVFTVWSNEKTSGVSFPFGEDGGYGIFWYLNGAIGEIDCHMGILVQPVYLKTYNFKIISTSIYNGSNSKIYENNNLKATINSGTRSFTSFEAGGGVGYYFNGYLQEIIVYNSVLTTEQITTVNNYLNSKYNVY